MTVIKSEDLNHAEPGARVQLDRSPQELVNEPPTSFAQRVPTRSRPGWQWYRERLHRHILKNPVEGIAQEEWLAHLEGMPPRYWESISEAELVWGLQNVHRFLHGNVVNASGDTAVAVDWRSFPYQGYTKVLVCTWDRPGLLARLAGYVSALRLNIVRAEVFTRADNIVIDVFWLCDGDNRHVAEAERLRQLAFLVEGGLCEPARFISEWACESHKLAPAARTAVPVIHFNNEDSAEHTVISVFAGERLGLLHDILKALGLFSLNITEALIDTVDDCAHDIFFVTDQHRRKILEAEQLGAIERALTRAIEGKNP